VEIAVTQARKVLADLVNRVLYGGEDVVLTRHGRVVGAIVSPEDYEVLLRLRDARIDLTQAEHAGASEALDRPAHRPDPLRIAAEHRPYGQPRRPGFGR
jgi:prevent-host-death family protein